MRVGIIAPNYRSGITGNSVTVRRIERHLRPLGCLVQVFPVDQLSAETLLAAVKDFGPQLLHAFHGYSGGRVAHAVAEALAIPYLVTLTGTDVYQALTDRRSHETHLALRGAACVVAFHASIKKRLAEHLPTLDQRTVVIAQGVEMPAVRPAEEASASDEFVFLLPAGLRPVKNVLFPVQPLADLHQSHPQVRFKLVGPVLDETYAQEVLEALEQHSFASYLGGVAHEAMHSLYRGANVVLNTSLVEGGMANSVLEALAYRKPVLASAIEGNSSVLKDGLTGLLYHDAADFKSKAEQLVTDPQLRERLARHGETMLQEKHSAEKEAQAYLDLYQSMLNAPL
jgi:L-malate glycosyltransferase